MTEEPRAAVRMGKLRVVELRVPTYIPWLSSNDRPSWQERARMTKRIRSFAYLQATSHKYPKLQRARLVVTVYRPTKQRADAPNLWPTVKAAMDGLVDAKVLPDDDDQHLIETTFRRGQGELAIHLHLHEEPEEP